MKKTFIVHTSNTKCQSYIVLLLFESIDKKPYIYGIYRTMGEKNIHFLVSKKYESKLPFQLELEFQQKLQNLEKYKA